MRTKMEVIRKRFMRGVPLCLMLAMAIMVTAFKTRESPTDYSALIDLIEIEDRVEPLYVFNEYTSGFDADAHKANLSYLKEHPDLIKKIRRDLQGEEVRWRLDNMSHRLLFVPEKRENYANLFKKYCEDVIDYVLEKTKLRNPYHDIKILIHEKPEISKDGITALLVHNLAKEYVATYIFFNEQQKEVSIELRGRFLIGDVGSYSTQMHVREDGTFEFVRDNYTIWQNSAKNPCKALVAPIEETLHIALRVNTERAIKEEIKQNAIKGLKEAEKVVEVWISVEEAIVGGVLFALLPDIAEKYMKKLSSSMIHEDIEARCDFKKYRHLKKAIELVEEMGYERALRIYKANPVEFKELLM
jgi:hypothetical protein